MARIMPALQIRDIPAKRLDNVPPVWAHMEDGVMRQGDIDINGHCYVLSAGFDGTVHWLHNDVVLSVNSDGWKAQAFGEKFSCAKSPTEAVSGLLGIMAKVADDAVRKLHRVRESA